MAAGSTNFPTDYDTYPELDQDDEITSTHHNDRAKAIEALERKLGYDDDPDSDTIDYRVQALEDLVPEIQTLDDGWRSLSVTPTVESYEDPIYAMRFAGIDLRSIISKGMRLRWNQTGGSNTHWLDLESGSSQYASRADTSSLSITGNITIEALIQLETFTSQGTIVSKWNQDGGVKAYHFYINTDGTLGFSYSGDGSAESSYTSTVPGVFTSDIGQPVHLSVVVTVSTRAVAFYRNGILVSSGTASGSQTAIQDNNASFAIGARDVQGTPDTFLDGKIMEVRLWSAARTQAAIQASMWSNLVGNESNLNAYWKLDNNYNDTTSNGNTLTASGSPVFATDVPSKFTGTTRYGIVADDVTFSTDSIVKFHTGPNYVMNNGTISSFVYSRDKSPAGFPLDPSKWTVLIKSALSVGQSTPSQNTWYNLGPLYVDIPIGAWNVSYKTLTNPFESSGTESGQATTLSTANNTESDSDFTDMFLDVVASGALDLYRTLRGSKPLEVTSRTRYYLNHKTSFSSQNAIQMRGDVFPSILRAVNAYL